MRIELMAFLYGGPDQLMPLTSGLAAVFAFLLIFWNKLLMIFFKVVSIFKRGGTHTGEGAGQVPPVKE
jgi:hypothetical protein